MTERPLPADVVLALRPEINYRMPTMLSNPSRRDVLFVGASLATAASVSAATGAAGESPTTQGSGYISLLHDCYRDEMWGSRLFRMMQELRPMAPREQALLGVLERTELAMQKLLAHVLRRHGQQWDAKSYAAQAEKTASTLAAQVGGLSWQAFNTGFEQAVPPYVAKYSSLRDIAPEQDREIMDTFVLHEDAYLRLARMEQQHEGEASLAQVWQALERAQRIAVAQRIS